MTFNIDHDATVYKFVYRASEPTVTTQGGSAYQIVKAVVEVDQYLDDDGAVLLSTDVTFYGYRLTQKMQQDKRYGYDRLFLSTYENRGELTESGRFEAEVILAALENGGVPEEWKSLPLASQYVIDTYKEGQA